MPDSDASTAPAPAAQPAAPPEQPDDGLSADERAEVARLEAALKDASPADKLAFIRSTRAAVEAQGRLEPLQRELEALRAKAPKTEEQAEQKADRVQQLEDKITKLESTIAEEQRKAKVAADGEALQRRIAAAIKEFPALENATLREQAELIGFGALVKGSTPEKAIRQFGKSVTEAAIEDGKSKTAAKVSDNSARTGGGRSAPAAVKETPKDKDELNRRLREKLSTPAA